MARLRAMRRGRRKGGMFKGVTHADLQRMLADAEAAGRDPFTVRDEDGRAHQLSVASARKMLEGFNGMVNFWRGKKLQNEVHTLNLIILEELHISHGET